MSRHSRWPVRVKRGNSTVTIYKADRKKNGRMYREFKLAYYNEIGKRTLRSFNSFKAARKAADNVNVSLMKGEVKSLVLSNDDEVVYLRALKVLKSTGTGLDLAAHQFAELVKVLGGASLLEAARYYIRRHPTKLPRKTVQEVVEEFIGSRRQAKRSEEYVQDLEYRLGRFAEAFQTCIADVGQSEVVRFLSGLGLSARSQYNFRKVLRTFFEFAKMQGYLPKDHDEMKGIELGNGDPGDRDLHAEGNGVINVGGRAGDGAVSGDERFCRTAEQRGGAVGLGRSAVGAGVHRVEALEEQDRPTSVGTDPAESGSVAGAVRAKERSGMVVR